MTSTASKTTPTVGDMHQCTCGCGQPTKSKFAIGHDARFASELRKRFEAGELTRAQAQKQADQVSPAFSRKVARSLELAAERQAEAKKAAQEKAKADRETKQATKPPSRTRTTKAPKPQVTVTDDPKPEPAPAQDAA